MRITYFYNKSFLLLDGVYTPHYESEFLFDLLDLVYKKGDRIMEIGSGSGAICISLCERYKIKEKGYVFAIEKNRIAYLNTWINILKNQSSVDLFHSDLFMITQTNFDIIISNPPYIRSTEVSKKNRRIASIKDALDGGIDGLDHINHILKLNAKYVILEVGYMEQIKIIMMNEEYYIVKVTKPLDKYNVFFMLLERRK